MFSVIMQKQWQDIGGVYMQIAHTEAEMRTMQDQGYKRSPERTINRMPTPITCSPMPRHDVNDVDVIIEAVDCGICGMLHLQWVAA